MIYGKSYAKINIFLNILNKRDDGFHEIETLFSKINLYDLIAIEKSENFKILINDESIPCNKENIIYKTYCKVIEKTQRELPKVTVRLVKNIPSGAGLGGGSSNAATFLKLLNQLLELGLSFEQQHEILAEIGSDTCFFLYDKPMLGKGRGELLVEGPDLPQLNILLVKPNIFISTKEIYQNLKLKLTSTKEVFRMRHSLDLQSVLQIMNNDLENPAMMKYKELVNLKNQVKQLGALKVLMSGSGSTIFGIFNSKNQLDNAFLFFKTNYPAYFIKKTNNI